MALETPDSVPGNRQPQELDQLAFAASDFYIAGQFAGADGRTVLRDRGR